MHSQPHGTYSKDSNEILRKNIEEKIEDIHGEEQLGFRRDKGSREAVGMLRNLEHRVTWCRILDPPESRLEISGKFQNVVLKKDGENQLD